MTNMTNIDISDFKDKFNTIFLSLIKDGYIMINSEYTVDTTIPDDYVYNSKNRGEKGMSFYKVIFKKKRKVIAELSFTVICDLPNKTISTYGAKVNIKDPSDVSNVRYLDKNNSIEYSTPYNNIYNISLDEFIVEMIVFMTNCIIGTEYYLLNEYSADPQKRWNMEGMISTIEDKENMEGFTMFLLDN